MDIYVGGAYYFEGMRFEVRYLRTDGNGGYWFEDATGATMWSDLTEDRVKVLIENGTYTEEPIE